MTDDEVQHRGECDEIDASAVTVLSKEQGAGAPACATEESVASVLEAESEIWLVEEGIGTHSARIYDLAFQVSGQSCSDTQQDQGGRDGGHH